MLMVEIRLGGIHKEGHGKCAHLFNIGDLTDSQQKRLKEEYEELHGTGTLIVFPSTIPTPIPDVNKPPQTAGLSNAAFLQSQYEIEKEIITLVDVIKLGVK